MRLELKQEQALRSAAKEQMQQLEARKDKHLSELASELGSVQAINKRLESELERARGELAEGERVLDNLKSELRERDRAIASLKTELEEKEQAIANLTDENQELEGYLAEAAKNEIFLQEELNRFKYGIKTSDFGSSSPPGETEQQAVTTQQLTLNLDPEQESTPEPKPEPTTGALTRGELVKYILENFPDSKINGQKITDAIAGKSKNLPKFEREYGFKYLGKIKGENQFQLV